MLALASPLVTSFSAAGTDYKAEFVSFKEKFSKVYETEEEEQFRFGAFVENLGAALAHNEANPKHATQGVTKFMDLTATEFASRYLNRKPKTADNRLRVFDGECTACVRFPEQAELIADPPDEFDWTTKGAVTPIKDQGQCGSCWSFGTTSDIEGTWFLAGNDLVSLSEQELVSCDTKGEDEGCNGGLQEAAFEYVIKNGLTTESNYPYQSGSGRAPKCDASKETPVAATISSWSQVASSGGEEDAIQTALLASGPITIGINASPMQRYNGGIDNPLVCVKASLDHAVTIVGYGTEDGTAYWKIRNSWNTDWGEDGYYRIVRGSNKCGLANDAVHSKV
jgi:C1A family cysteine protease